jgi:hypothetical protein
MKPAMVPVRCHTNLDLWHAEKWPQELPCRPMKGDRIRSLWNDDGKQLELEVVGIVLHPEYVEVELHMHGKSIRDFEEWYKRFRGVSYVG